ncbi:MAG: zeta toxin family protein, partial [Pseudomonadota bacterium]
SNYLEPYIRDGARSLEGIEKTLSTLRGLSAPEAQTPTKEQPTFVLVAGPNGAGKSTLSASETFKDFKIIDPDAIARQQGLTGTEAPLNAFKEAVRQQQTLLSKGESFVTETTLAATNGIRLLEQAKEAGFKTELHFVGLKDVSQSHERVADRVKTGGHNIPAETLDERFPKVLKNLPEAISAADKTVLYDNSGQESHRQVAELTREKSTFERDTPKWAASAALNAAILDQQRATNDQASVQATHRAYDAARAAGISDEQIKQINQETVQRQAEQVRQT